MNEEENKAVEDSKDLIKVFNNHKDKDFIDRLYYKNKPIEEILKALLNLIEKLQKENKELKEDRDKFKKALGKRITYCNELEKDLFENCSNYVISKQKVKDKIDELKIINVDGEMFTTAVNFAILILQELIKEREEK